ncbi:MAG TPA: LLM class F420-dependent oxidoreductase [Stellaceae bacterium]|jgi:F420-dependent oxidoreductase-like protein
MKLSITLKLSSDAGVDMGLVWEAENLGFDTVWAGEAYGTDAVTPVAWVLARTSRIKAGTGIMQMPARTPACAAMTAMTLQALSGNRFVCGVGPSGPQVIEGWHGVPFGQPLTRTREYISIIRQILAREAPLEHHGAHYDIPYTGPGGSGLARKLRSTVHGDPSLKIYTAPNSPAGLRVSGEVADGALPYFMSPEKAHLMLDPIREGRAKAGRPSDLIDFDLAPYIRVSMGDDLAKCRDELRPGLALYIGGMGARGRNFYNDLAKRLGYEASAEVIQDHYLAGRRNDAIAAVPDALIDEISLVGSKDRIVDRLSAWQDLARRRELGSLVLSGADPGSMRVIAEAVL